MAKVMTLSDLKLKPSRSGFDLSKMRQFSAKSGELLPVDMLVTLPDDKFEIDLSHFSRTVPLLTPAYTRFREYFDVFFVPLQTLWHDFPTYWQSLDDQQQKSFSLSEAAKVFDGMPYVNTKDFADYIFEQNRLKRLNSFGYNRADLSCKLLQYLGYGDFKPFVSKTFDSKPMYNEKLSPLPLCAYQKFYNDHYRFEAWEKTSPWTWNLDFLTPSTLNLGAQIVGLTSKGTPNTLLDMRYVNFERDLYFLIHS